MDHVRGRDEHDLREVVLRVEVVVHEGVVLLGVEDLEERRGRIAPEVHRHLVDLVEEEHGVHRPRLLHELDDLAGERADVRAPVAADLGLVAHAAEREAHELAVERLRDALRERRLADAGRAREAQDRPARLRDELAHGEELEDALLDLLEAVVVLVQDLLGALDVLRLARRLLPGHRHEPVDVVARDGGLGGDVRHRLEPLELGERLLLRLLRHPGLLDLGAELLDLVGLVVLLAELLVDRLDLLVEVVLLLGPLHLLLDLVVDPAIDVDLLDLDLEQVLELLEALERVHRLEERLLLRRRDRRRKVAGEHVGEGVGVVHLERREEALERELVRELGELLEDARAPSTGTVRRRRPRRRADAGRAARPSPRGGPRPARTSGSSRARRPRP